MTLGSQIVFNHGRYLYENTTILPSSFGKPCKQAFLSSRGTDPSRPRTGALPNDPNPRNGQSGRSPAMRPGCRDSGTEPNRFIGTCWRWLPEPAMPSQEFPAPSVTCKPSKAPLPLAHGVRLRKQSQVGQLCYASPTRKPMPGNSGHSAANWQGLGWLNSAPVGSACRAPGRAQWST
jgi:hypothetical protein